MESSGKKGALSRENVPIKGSKREYAATDAIFLKFRTRIYVGELNLQEIISSLLD